MSSWSRTTTLNEIRYEKSPLTKPPSESPAKPVVEHSVPKPLAKPFVEHSVPKPPAKPVVEHSAPKLPAKPVVEHSALKLPAKRDLEHVVYATPKCTDTAVLMVFFNPAGSFRIIQNILYIKQQLAAASIPFFIAELAYNTAPHVIPGAFQFRSSSYMFSKENLLNALLAKDEVKAFSKYVIMDCDIVFDTADWLDGVSTALDSQDIIQPYQNANVLNLKFKSEQIKPSMAYTPNGGHTGYVWAFHRDWYDRVGGLYEYALVGGGDTCLAYLCGFTFPSLSKAYKDDMPPSSVNKISYLPYTIWHLPHGQPGKRQYKERMDVILLTMKSLQIDRLRNAVDRGADGILEWKPQYKTHLNSVLLNYFKSREDDG